MVIQYAMLTRWANFLEVNKGALLEQWLDCALALFPEKMEYSTPVAMMLSRSLEAILSGLGESGKGCQQDLDDVTRILAVQSIPPSKALSIFFELKLILRSIMMKTSVAERLSGEALEACFARLDSLTLEAFDSYMQHREKLYQLKVEEGRRRMFMALRGAEA